MSVHPATLLLMCGAAAQLHHVFSCRVMYLLLQVVLQSGRVIEGDFACLDPQGNLILSNASEHVQAAHSSSSNSSSKSSSSSPALNPMGIVLVPKAQQKDVLLQVTLSEKASMLSLAGSS